MSGNKTGQNKTQGIGTLPLQRQEPLEGEGTVSGGQPLDDDDYDPETVKGATLPPPRMESRSATGEMNMPNPDRFPNTVVAIASDVSEEDGQKIAAALGRSVIRAKVDQLTDDLPPSSADTNDDEAKTLVDQLPGWVDDILLDKQIGEPEEPDPVQRTDVLSAEADSWQGDDHCPRIEDLPRPDVAFDHPQPQPRESGPVDETAARDVPAEDPHPAEPSTDNPAVEAVGKDEGSADPAVAEEAPVTSIPPSKMVAFVQVVETDGQTYAGELIAMIGDELIIGREGCGLNLSSPHVSRQHALIAPASDRSSGCGYNIVDLQSSNGTFIDGFKIEADEEVPLADGSSIRLGTIGRGVTLHFRCMAVDHMNDVPPARVSIPAAEVTDDQLVEEQRPQPADAPKEEAKVTEQEQRAPTQSIDAVDQAKFAAPTRDVAEVALPKSNNPPKNSKDGKPPKLPPTNGGGTPPASDGSVWLRVALITLVVVGAIVGYIAFHKTGGETEKAVVATVVAPDAKPAFVKPFTAPIPVPDFAAGEPGDEMSVGVQAPDFSELQAPKREPFKVEDFQKEEPSAAEKRLKEFADGIKNPATFRDCFPTDVDPKTKKQVKADTQKIAWCCAGLHPNPGRLDELVRMLDCYAKLEQLQY